MSTRTRTCVKCRLHGKISILKGHKRNCDYTHCCCDKCASHENLKEVRQPTESKSQSTSTATTSSFSTNAKPVSFPDMSAKDVLNLASLETHDKNLQKGRSMQEKRQGKT